MIKKIDFNVNDFVFVKLTNAGIEELKRQHDELRKEFPSIKGDFTQPKTDEDGYSRWQMHNLMNSFGHMMTLGCEVPFETKIRFCVNIGDKA